MAYLNGETQMTYLKHYPEKINESRYVRALVTKDVCTPP